MSNSMVNTKNLIVLLCTLANGLVKAKNNDGKIDVADLQYLLPLLPQLGALQHIGEIPAEFAHFSAEDGQELVAALMSTLNIGDAHAVAIINESIKTAVQINSLVNAIKA